MDQPESTWKPHRRVRAPVKGPRANMNNGPGKPHRDRLSFEPGPPLRWTLAFQTL